MDESPAPSPAQHCPQKPLCVPKSILASTAAAQIAPEANSIV